jgi:hypothetical protein
MKVAFFILLSIAIFFTAVFGVDGIYVGLYASEQDLSNYPWGTELGWAYINKTNYMYAGLVKTMLSWLPVCGLITINHLTKRLYKDELSRAA